MMASGMMKGVTFTLFHSRIVFVAQSRDFSE